MRMRAVTTCIDEEEELTGVFISLRDPDDEEGTVVNLQMLGTEGEFCDTLTLGGPIDKVAASVTQMEVGFFVVNAIRYVRDPNQKTYGTYLQPFGQEWSFNETHQLIGLIGQVNPLENNAIVQLGIITLNTECQADVEAELAEMGIEEDHHNQPREIRLRQDESSGPSLMVIIIIAAAVTVIILVIVIILVLRSRNNKDKKTTPRGEADNNDNSKGETKILDETDKISPRNSPDIYQDGKSNTIE